MHYVFLLLAGALLCNSIPHLASGLRGEPFPSPFAKPRGVGMSSPLVNFFWGTLNLLLGIWILSRHPVAIGLHLEFATVVVGALFIGTHLSLHFGKVRSGAVPGKTPGR